MTAKAPIRTGRRGMTLLEVLLASVILSTSLLYIYNALGIGHRSTARVEDEILATNLCQDLLEYLASLGYSRLPRARGPTGVVNLPVKELPGLVTGIDPDSMKLRLDLSERIDDIKPPENYEILISIEPQSSREGRDRSEWGNLTQITVETRWIAQMAQGHKITRKVRLMTLVTNDEEVDS